MASYVNCGTHQKKSITHKRKRKRDSKNYMGLDLISSLADDILIPILSSLDIKEAARTSVLSKRWRHLWANLPDLYNFDTSGMLWLELQSYDAYQYKTELRKYVDYVNQVVSSTANMSAQNFVDRFTVRCPLDVKFRHDVRKWANFALERGVKELELNLLSGDECPPKPVYLGPFGRYAKSPSAKTLVSLSLTSLEISYSFLISVLFNLPNLERLTISSCIGEESHIRVVGSSLKLKYLEISGCTWFEKVEISASNLVSFVCTGDVDDVKFISVPLLNEVSCSGNLADDLIRNFQPIPGFSSQLTKLSLTICTDLFDSRIKFPHFQKLKQLELETWCDSYKQQSLLVLANLIDACPVLHRFKLRIPSFQRPETKVKRSIDRVSNKVHRGLKTFEMDGFVGCRADIELILCLARFAILLEKVIIHPLDEEFCSRGLRETMFRETRKQTKLLEDQLPARVRLEFL